MVESLVTTVLGVTFLFIFFRAIEVQWPASYATLDSGVEYAITASPASYILFRFAPILATCLFVSVSLDRAGKDPILAVAAICVIHALATNGRAALGLIRAHAESRKAPLWLMHSAVVVGIGLAGLLALLLDDAFAPAVPSVQAISATLWTALLAGIVGAFLVHVARSPGIDVYTVAERSRRAIPSELWVGAAQLAADANTDVRLVRAIMIVENLERPRWFRVLENLKGRVFPKGTYGIMQIAADGPISDEESLRRCVTTQLAGVHAPIDAYGMPDRDFIEGFARRYNADARYARNVADVYFYLYSEETNPSS